MTVGKERRDDGLLVFETSVVGADGDRVGCGHELKRRYVQVKLSENTSKNAQPTSTRQEPAPHEMAIHSRLRTEGSLGSTRMAKRGD
jgi:hypothetical protein